MRECQDIIKENEKLKQKADSTRKIEKIKEQQLLVEIRKQGEEIERKRQQEWQNREELIKKKMSLMADNVLKKHDEQEKELERRLIKIEEQKDREAKKEEQIRKLK